jgi:hypothetical protein
MNEKEAASEALRSGRTQFVYPGSGEDDLPGLDNPAIMDRALDILELQSVRAAMKLMENVAAWSRTPNAGKLRMMAIQYAIFGEPSVDEIAFRTGRQRRRVFSGTSRSAVPLPAAVELAPRRAIVKYICLESSKT